jgi:hypothetical protein
MLPLRLDETLAQLEQRLPEFARVRSYWRFTTSA